MFYWIPVDDSANLIYVIWRLHVVFNVKKKQTEMPTFISFKKGADC